MSVDRRTFVGASIASLAMVTPAARVFAQGGGPALASLHEAAKKEGELTWYIAHWETEFAEKVGHAFTAAYPGVNCNVVRATSQVIYQRLSQDMKAKVANCDVFSSADNGQYVALAKDRMLMAYEPQNLKFCPPILQSYDPNHFVTITDSNPTVLCFNTKLVNEADAPKKWADFLDPKWKDQISLPHPGYSGAMGAWVIALNNLYGWDFFDKLKKNNPLIGRSLADPPTVVASGERKVGISTLATPTRLADKGATVKAAYPEEGSILNVGPSAIMANTTHPNAAKLFMEFLLDKTCGQLASEYYAIPVRTDVEPRKGIEPLGKLKGIKSDPVELEAKLPGLIEKWRDTFGV